MSATRQWLLAVALGLCVVGGVQAQTGPNLSLGAGADGSSKGGGTSYGNVIDGDPGTWWSPSGTTGRISVKWSAARTVGAAVIREPTGQQGRIGNWRLVNNGNGQVLATGNGAGTIAFAPVSLSKLNFEIISANGTPAVAEFETYADGGAANPPGTPWTVTLSASASGATAQLTWSVGGGTPTRQQVYRDGDADPAGRTLVADHVVGGSYADAGLAAGTYFYWVRVFDDSGTAYESAPVAVTVASGGGDGGGGGPGSGIAAACRQLLETPSMNWRQSPVLTSDQAIVQCLSDSLGSPVGFGHRTTGGYAPAGGSTLVVITKSGAVSPEQQILQAIGTDTPTWIVFDKVDFAAPTEIGMYRNGCEDPKVRNALGNASVAECRDHRLWCSNRGVSTAACEDTFFNTRLNDASLDALKLPMVRDNTTIDGRGANARFIFSGLKIGADSSGSPTHSTRNVIVTNNHFFGVGHTEDHNLDPDMVRSTGASHDIWIHQNTFENTGDSAYDVKVGAYDITVSFNRLHNVKRAALHGASDSHTIDAQITSTVHNNLYVTTDDVFGASAYNGLRRVPLLRRGQSHLFNNVFYGYRKDVLSVRVGGRLAFEDNLLLNNSVNSKGDDLDDWIAVLLRDVRDTSGLRVEGSVVRYSDANCQAHGVPGDLTRSVGAVPDMLALYDARSLALFEDNWLPADMDLARYVFATAGKGGLAPYLSPATPGFAAIVAAAPAGCQ
ncbi:hypothetical protein MNO14_11445 [Luteimonas sp. S4-F44]|uniref:pectate lyase family protein n=1 Tax=Luteimonas sp. S4-F44 TaxID=2925842 RepID=UPI001F533A04|nr:hypothetical protein [Luteimonas sp. S4-F44]UNK41575.1 hypothetical protein MNO14_11445 [Luteimonas sp. S4-F44]